MCCSTLSLRQGAKIYWLSFKKCGTPGRQKKNTIGDGGMLYVTHQMSRKKDPVGSKATKYRAAQLV